MYYLFYAIGFIAAVLYILFFAKKFSITKVKGILLLVFCYITIYFLMLLLYYAVKGVFGGQNMIRVFAFIPFAVIFFSKAFDIETTKALDYFAPVPVIIFGLSHIGCIWEGCCRSNIEVPWGMVNVRSGETLFPNQLLEAALALLTAVLLIYILYRHNYNLSGKAMGYMLIIYGTQRFFLEFIRDNDKLFWGISELALWAAGAVAVGVIMNYILNYKRGIK